MTARQVAREVLWWAAIVPPLVRGVRRLADAVRGRRQRGSHPEPREYCRLHQAPRDVVGTRPCLCPLLTCRLEASARRVPRKGA